MKRLLQTLLLCLVGIAASTQGASAQTEECTVTYNLQWKGVTKATHTTTVTQGSNYPEVKNLPFGVEVAYPEGQVTADVTLDIECHLAKDYPVKLVESYDELTDATFYILEQNPGDTDGYWTYKSSYVPNVRAVTKDAPTAATLANKSWGFVGNPFDGVAIYNREAGPTMTLGKIAPYRMVTTEPFLWTIDSGTRSAFFISSTPGHYINLQSGQLKTWTAKDGGSTVKATPTSTYIILPTDDYTTFEAGTRPADLGELALWYPQPGTKQKVADKWMDYGLCIGNGQVGAVLLGGVLMDEIQFNEKTLWAGGTASRDHSGGYGAFQNFGSLLVFDRSKDFDEAPVKGYNRYLDIENGVAGVNFSGEATQYSRRYITSAPDKVLAARYTAQGDKKLNLQFVYNPDGQINADEPVYKDGTGSFSGSLEMVDYNTLFRVVTDGDLTTNEGGVTVSGNATYAEVYLAAGTTFDLTNTNLSTGSAATVEAQNKTLVDAAIAKGWERVLADHVSNFSGLMNRVQINLGGGASKLDTKALIDAYQKSPASSDGLFLEKLYYQFGRYLTISSNNINTLGAPSNLQGIWNKYSNSAFWLCDIHADINVQMNYWPVEAANLSEMHKPFLDHIIYLSRDGYFWRDLAKKTMGDNVRGWMISTENNIYGGVSNWMLENMKTHNGWYVSHLWNHYKYTLDRDFLRDAFPAIYGAATFLMDISTATSSKDGKREIPAEWSPEHGASSGFNNTFVTAYAQQNAVEAISEAIEAAGILGLADAGITQEQLDELKNFYATMDLGLNTETYLSKTCLSEWKYKTLNHAGDCSSHRHLSHLMALYPYNQVSAFATDDEGKTLYEAAKNSLAARSTEDVTGWSMGWKVNCLARTLEGDKAHKFLAKALKHSNAYDIQMSGKGGMYYNMWDAHSPFQIDGNFGVCAGVNEMLLQSYDGVLHILPALPSVWGEGSVDGLKAVGNFTVGIVWHDGKAAQVNVVSHKGAPLVIDCKDIDLSKTRILVDGAPVTPEQNGTYYTIPSSAGSVIEVLVNGTYDRIDAQSTNVSHTPYYDLQGRRVEPPFRGIYVHNGQKVKF